MKMLLKHYGLDKTAPLHLIGDQICVVQLYVKADAIAFAIKRFLLALRRNKKKAGASL